MPEPVFPASAAGSAMQRAVIAEQDARLAIAQAGTDAAAAVESARAQARAMLDAVPARIERLRLRGTHAVEQALKAIAADEAAALQALGQTAFPQELMQPVTDAVAARLSGADPEQGA